MKSQKEKKIIILGGGPAGISCGYELVRNGYLCEIIEKFSQVGGLSKTLRIGDFLTDIGPHRFFSKNKYLYDLIEEVLGEEWILVDRLTRFFIQGSFYKYPVEFMDTLRNLGIYKSARALSDYFYSRIKKTMTNPPVRNFEDYVVLEFGRTLADLNMLNYTEKIWGLPCSQISSDWARQRIKNLSFISLLKKALFRGKSEAKTLADQFYYPKLGASQTFETMAEKIEKKGSGICLSNRVIKIYHENYCIESVLIESDKDHTRKLKTDELVSSIPITELIEILDPPPPDNVLKSAGKLKWRNQVYLYLQLNKVSVTHDNWIYFPDKEISFGRFHEPRNFSKIMSPSGKTSLMIEHFVFPNDERWNCSAERLYEITMKDLEKLGFVKPEQVEYFEKHREEHVYPVYDLEYQSNIEVVKKYLAGFSNLQLVGRGGRFRYNNQDHSIETGILAARNIMESRQYDLEKIGSEDEYFEKGYVAGNGKNPESKATEDLRQLSNL